MTHLESLLRILPRQRRAYRAQRILGLLVLVLGLLSGAGTAIVDRPAPTQTILFGWIVIGTLILFGGYRITRADLMIAEVESTLEGVHAVLDEEDQAREDCKRAGVSPSHGVQFRINANTDDIRDEFERGQTRHTFRNGKEFR